ncbi:MAG TPA: SMI1/KNR4 family protein [Ktedonobacterales bacterium]
MQTMEEVWKRIEVWLATHASHILGYLQPGATDEEIRQAEVVMGVELPEDVKASYRLHNGSAHLPLIERLSLNSLEEMVQLWQGMKRILDDQDPTDEYIFGVDEEQSDLEPLPVKAVWWCPKWIPLLEFGNGDGLYVDLAPGPKGRSGQLVSFWHEDASMNDLVAPSWQAYLSAFADDLEAGKYFIDEWDDLATTDDLTQQARWTWVDRY